MNCRKVNNLLSAYIDGELPGVEQLQMRDHLRICAECSEEHESLLRTKRMISSISAKAPQGALEQRILDRLAEESRRPVLASPLQSWWGLLGEPERARYRVGALLAVLGIVSAIYVTNPLVQTPDRVPASLARVAPTAASTPAMPVSGYVRYHNFYELNAPLGGGVNAEPVGYHPMPAP